MPRTRIASLIAALAVVAAACSIGGATATPGAGGQGSTEPGSSQPAVVASFASAGGGSCGVQIDGDVTKAWHTDQTTATLLVSYWLSPSGRSLLGVQDGTEEFLFNCQSDQGPSISLTSTAGTTAAQFPKAPGTYVIEPSGLLGDHKPGEIQALINLKDGGLWNVAENGTFTITSFSPSHLAGSFNMKIAKSGANLQSIVASATVSGTFDLGCTGDACS